MKSTLARFLLLVGLVLGLASCASYHSELDRGRSLAKFQRFFVLSNLNDNHAIDRQIAEQLKARGREADAGPLTMMPDNNQVIVMFQDRWAWDFGEHLVFLQIAVRDTHSAQPFASVTFSAKIPLHEEASVTIARVVDQLLDSK